MNRLINALVMGFLVGSLLGCHTVEIDPDSFGPQSDLDQTRWVGPVRFLPNFGVNDSLDVTIGFENTTLIGRGVYTWRQFAESGTTPVSIVFKESGDHVALTLYVVFGTHTLSGTVEDDQMILGRHDYPGHTYVLNRIENDR